MVQHETGGVCEGKRQGIKLLRYFDMGNGNQRPHVGGPSFYLQNNTGDSICGEAEGSIAGGLRRTEAAREHRFPLLCSHRVSIKL